MYFSARERHILDKLLNEKDITVQILAEYLGVSTRTIHRDLKRLEPLLKKYDMKLIKKAGVGLQVVGDLKKMEQLRKQLHLTESEEYTPEERQRIVLCTLLNSPEPMKLVALAQDLRVTVATISNDLTKIEERLVKSDLQLVRKRGFGIQLVGPESAKRRMMSQIISQSVGEVEFLKLMREHHSQIAERLLGLVEKEKVFLVERTVASFIKTLPYSITDRAYIGLVIHLSLAMERIMQGEKVYLEPTYIENLKNTKEFEFAHALAQQLSEAFQVEIHDAEVGYITMHLQGAKLRHEQGYVMEESTFEIAIKVKEFIQFVEKRTNVPLSKDDSLFQGLVVHLKPALYRIKQQMSITNPLLKQIKEDYAELFQVVKEGVQETFPHLQIPDEEVGYLVLHVGSALMGNQVNPHLKALIICSSGIGTSKMLFSRIKNELPEVKELTNVSLFELNDIDISKYDLILSTISLPQFNWEHIVVSPILTKKEIQTIKRAIHQKRQQYLIEKEEKEERNDKPEIHVGETIERIQTVKEYSDIIYHLLQEMNLTVISASSLPGILNEVCRPLYEKGVLTDVQLVTNALLKREELGGLGIPNTKLALFHTRSKAICRPSFTIGHVIKGCQVKAMDGSKIEMKTILLLVAPEEVSHEVLEILSYISASIIESEESIKLFESNNQPAITSYMAMKLEQFLQEKLNY